jgi:hypothetical protein
LWETIKVVLAWLVDTVCQTIELPLHRILHLKSIFDELQDIGGADVSVKKIPQQSKIISLKKIQFYSESN